MQLDKTLIRILILAVPFYFVRFSVGPIPTTLLEVVIYLIFLTFLFSKKFHLSDKAKYIYPAILFLVAGIIGAVIDPDKAAGFGLWKAYFLDGFLVYLMVLSIKDREDFNETIFYSGILVSALTLLLFFTGVKTADGRILDLDKLSPNYLAMFLTPAVVIGIWQTYKKTNISNILGSALILAALYFTGSRGAIIGIGGAIVFGIYYYLRRRNFKFSNLALIGMIIVFLASGYAVFKPDWSDHARKSTSSNIRYYIWQTSLEIISKNPIAGVGLSNYQNYFTNLTIDRVNYPEYISPVALSAHDIYLELFATCGIFGLLTFLYLVFRSGFLKKDHVASLALVAILAYGLVDTPFFRNDLAIMFWIILAIVYNGDKSAKTSKAIS